MLNAPRKLLSLFQGRHRWMLVGLLGVQIAMGLVQVAGIGSIFPFLTVLADPEGTQRMPWLAWFVDGLGIEDRNTLLFALGLMALLILVISNLVVAAALWLLTRFSWSTQYRLSRTLLERYLAEPYVTFLNRNTADLGKNILIETQQLTRGVILPLLQVTAFGVSAVFIMAFLVLVNPILTAIVVGVVGGGFLAVYWLLRRRMTRAGQERLQANLGRFQSVNEAFGGLKEVKVLGREAGFVRRFDPPARSFARSMAVSEVGMQVPRYAVEVLAFGGILLLVLYLLGVQGNLDHVIPVAGLYAFAGYRLLPALHNVQQGATQIRFNRSVIDEVLDDLAEVGREPSPGGQQAAELPLAVREEIRFEGVSFTYPGATEPALSDVTLVIRGRKWVAFAGETGSGKTTLVDVLLGLLRPQAGEILIDGEALTDDHVRSWQRRIGYVPQEIYLADDTVAANIAFGVPAEEIDREAVESAAAAAHIGEFVESELPARYETVVGERGVRLSGGQRQRIGIARALYHQPPVLVLDEATSALDGATETMVLKAVADAMRDRTVIMIAHRLASVRGCDRIFLLDDGRLVAEGSYEELFERDARFRAMAGSQQGGSG